MLLPAGRARYWPAKAAPAAEEEEEKEEARRATSE